MKEFTRYLVCAGCGKQLSGVEFTDINGQPFCETCEPVEVPFCETCEPVEETLNLDPLTLGEGTDWE